MADHTAMLQQWQNLKTQAESGELRMESDIAAKLAAHCDGFIARLDEALLQTDDLAVVEGFGGLRSAQYLRDKFAKKAVEDPDSASNRLRTAIDIVNLMKQTFELSCKQIEEVDQSTSSALGNTGV
ncbi:hypothetical protein [Nocardia carnea]|uniref:hypothetical protein n=1 Tax=Nocardia carnea TaxID=37328 RepID=UPI002458D3B3|nr:hypothetical protein [Nocardia carnea]